MPVIDQSVIDSWLARYPARPVDKPTLPAQPAHRLGKGEIPCPFCGAPALPHTPWKDTIYAGVEGLYQCDPFVEGSCCRVFIPRPAPWPQSVEKLIKACEHVIRFSQERPWSGLGDYPEPAFACQDALCAVDLDLAEMKRKEQP